MLEESNQVQVAQKKASPLIFIFGAVLVIVLGIILVEQFIIPALTPEVMDNEVAGVIVISAVDTNDESQLLNQTFVVDFSNSELQFEKISSNILPYSIFVDFKDVLNPTEFILRTMTFESLQEEVNDRIHMVDLVSGKASFFPSATSSNPENLDWSKESNLIAYQVSDFNLPPYEAELISNHNIEVFSPAEDAVIQVITEAAQPQWSPDGTKLLYFKNDGLYLRDVRDGSDVLILGLIQNENNPAGNFIDANSMFAVSPDGKAFAWTAAFNGSIHTFAIESWEPFQFSDLGRVYDRGESEYYWPVFSPDGNFLSVQAIDTAEDPLNRTNSRLEIRKVKDVSLVKSISLEQFDFNALFTDDWIVDSEFISDLRGN